ncbi:HAD family hydrolase [Teichococcus aestuarii]|uniref:Phosphoglycolate phosphatase n=1 Tax=Teichococcus aestuarii TaxID=568898 RepID=A0A2U1V8C9_9PROT|nr:HAD family phosphatase [Pseudoroseomonas aestuarii]PWC30169.1 phosphoglycolate phosphatase [Pseudoroseomonas aestuarii]
MRAAASRPAAILFDCDGVLADSEALAAMVVAEELTERGWPVSPEECQHIFLGRAVPDMMPIIEQRFGPVPDDWPARMSRRLTERMARDVVPVPGAKAAVAALRAAGMTLACASNSSRAELSAKLGRLDLAAAFEGRVFSFEDVDRPKPYPDIYRAAALSCGAAPEDCVVVEDSLPGIRAGRAAGCRVLALVWDMPEAMLRAQGAEPFRHMDELPGLLGVG